MNATTIGIGAIAIAYGIFTGAAHAKWPHMFKKLQPMKERWGTRAGMALHLTGYTVVPITFGVVAVLAGLVGVSLF